jgi:twitching motility protein PilT
VRSFDELLEIAVEKGASDLHLTVGAAPILRINGELVPLEGEGAYSPDDLQAILWPAIEEPYQEIYEEQGEVDFSLSLPGVGRFRCNLYRQRGSIGIAVRIVSATIPSLDELGLPPVVQVLCQKRNGLILVTGPAGSGKSTTLAAMIDLINSSRPNVIITLEDPIEYLHRHRLSVVNQREVGHDTKSFASGLRAALREDPDVILVGEMRDLETMSTAINAAETGHLVLSTVHTRGATWAVERLVSVFPAHQQQQVRMQLASVLQGVISQLLLPRLDGKGMVPAVEVLVQTPAVANIIREGKPHQLKAAMEIGARHGMQTMEAALAELVRRGLVDPRTILEG